MKSIRTIGIFVILFFAVACIITTVSFSQSNVITLRYSNFMPPGDPQSEIGDQWCKEVEKRTNGRVQVR
jgi:TRAP-type C4-dicarboxylate transport system substrate-binding protein